MSFRVVRDGDKNSAGGKAIAQQRKVLVDGKPVVTVGSRVTPHKPGGKHNNAKTNEGTPYWIIEGKRVNVVTDKDTCGHPRVEGSPKVIVGK